VALAGWLGSQDTEIRFHKFNPWTRKNAWVGHGRYLHHHHSKWFGIFERISLAAVGFFHSHSAVLVGFAVLGADAALIN